MEPAQLHEEANTMSKTPKTKNPHVGGGLDDFLKEEGTYQGVQTTAIRRVLASQLEQARFPMSLKAKRVGAFL